MADEESQRREAEVEAAFAKQEAENAKVQRDAALYTAVDATAQRDQEAVKASAARSEAGYLAADRARAQNDAYVANESANAISWTAAVIVFLVVAALATGALWWNNRHDVDNARIYNSQSELQAQKAADKARAEMQNNNQPPSTVIVTPNSPPPSPPVVVHDKTPASPPVIINNPPPASPAPKDNGGTSTDNTNDTSTP